MPNKRRGRERPAGARPRSERRPARPLPRDIRARNKVVLRSWLVFVAVFLGLLALFVRWGSLIQEQAVAWTARATAGALALLGADGRADGSLVTSSLYSVRIIFECTGVFPVMIFVAAVIAYPCGLRPKLLGLGVGVPGLLLLNEIRLVSLFYVGYWFPQVFDTLHLVVWQSLMIFFTVLLWLLWSSRFGTDHAAQPA